METEILSINGNPFKIWYASPEYRPHAIRELQNQIHINSLQTNLIQNPEFESGTGNIPSNWTSIQTGSTATFSYPVTGRTGNAVSITYPSIESGAEAYWYQDVPITSGQSYTLSVYASLSNVAGSGASIQIDWFNASGNWLATSVVAGGLIGTSGFTNYTGTVTAPINASTARITLLLPTSSVTVTFDDVSFISTGGGTTPPPPGGTTPPPGGTTPPPPGGTAPPPTQVTCPSGQINLLGTCVPKNYLIYGGIGLVALILLKR